MYPEFAYSQAAQILLAVQTFLTNTFIIYLITNLILMIYDEKRSTFRKLVFSFVIGALCHTAIIYGVYLIVGASRFSAIVYAVVVCPNPLVGLLYYILGIKILDLSQIRSLKIVGYFYIYFIMIINLHFVVVSLFPSDHDPRYNYLQDMITQLIYPVIVLLAYLLTKHALVRSKLTVRLTDKLFVNPRKEMIIFLMKLVLPYAYSALIPIVLRDPLYAPLIIMISLLFFMISNILFDLYSVARIELENRAVHIGVLSKGISEFSGVKHDFYNILQTYNGYLEIGDLEKLKQYHAALLRLTTHAGNSVDFSRRMAENPAFLSLLAQKAEYAALLNVEMSIKLQCSPENLYIDTMDICRCVSCLLDNAVEAAALSAQKKILFTLEAKSGGGKLIIITNSTAEPVDIREIVNPGVTNKQGHLGLGLFNIRKTLERYGNCSFQMNYYNYELTSYIELRPSG